MNSPATLPDADALRVDEAKLRDYLLDVAHPEGGPKAEFFGRFGFTRREWRTLAEALRLHGRTQPVVLQIDSRHGRKLHVRCEVRSPDGRNPCITSV